MTPGVTGLWQVSGRNDCGLRDRVRLDSYYVRNWSPWLDLHILAPHGEGCLYGAGSLLMRKNTMERRVLITGAAGFIGRTSSIGFLLKDSRSWALTT